MHVAVAVAVRNNTMNGNIVSFTSDEIKLGIWVVDLVLMIVKTKNLG